MINLDAIFDEISFYEELNISEGNIEQLKQLGDVVHIITEKDGVITEHIEFVAHGDNMISFSKSFFYNKDDKEFKRQRLNKEIEVAVSMENYELAQRLKEE